VGQWEDGTDPGRQEEQRSFEDAAWRVREHVEAAARRVPCARAAGPDLEVVQDGGGGQDLALVERSRPPASSPLCTRPMPPRSSRSLRPARGSASPRSSSLAGKRGSGAQIRGKLGR